MVCGRRWGKTFAATNEALKLALVKPNSLVWMVAPTFPLTETMWETLNRFVPRETLARKGEAKLFMQFNNGSMIQCRSADNPDSLISKGLDLVIVDEAAQVDPHAWYQSLRPALADKKGKAIFISTPKGRNWFFDIFQLGQDPQEKEWKSFNFPSSTNPYLAPEEIEAMRRSMPERLFDQEVLAEFKENSGAVFRNIEKCIGGDYYPYERFSNHSFVLGVDLARYHDYTVIIVIDVDTHHVCFFDRFSSVDFNLQKQRILNTARKYKAQVYIDSTSMGLPVLEDLRRENITVHGVSIQTAMKQYLIDGLSIALEQEKLSFPNEPVLINELRSYEYTSTPSGNVKSGAPKGKFDDCVFALALAWYGTQKGRWKVSVYHNFD